MENKYIRKKFDGLTAEVHDWECLLISSFYKEEIRKISAEKEIVEAYMHAANSLYSNLSIENHPSDGITVFRTNQMCIPVLFLLRHAIELTMKLVLEKNNSNVENGHRLNDLWEKVKKNEKIECNEFDELISAYVELDSSGLQLRYVKDRDGKEYKIEPYFIKLRKIVKDTNKYYEFLFGLYNKERKEG